MATKRKTKRQKINYMAIVAVVLGILGGFGTGYMFAPTVTSVQQGCVSRLQQAQAPGEFIAYVCFGRLPQESR